ncbi:MFS transporter [Streptomyces werraensis]|uniref:MFS transporter n=1 Tax=Streptomyces werraensis TaxID=68284 RepID=UPI001CE37445
MGRTGAQPAPAPAAAAPGYRAVLRAPGTRAVFAAHAVSTAGKLAAEVALSILVHQRTGSPLLSSLVLVCAFAPHAVGGTALSALADRFPPRRVLAGCDLLAAACVAAMLLPGLPVAALLLLLLGTGLVAPVTQGARTASLTQLPDDDLFPVGRSLLRTVSQTAVVTGFALGSVLVAAVGPYRMLAADAASLLVSAALVGLCTPATPALAPDGRRSPAGVLADSADGLRRLFADRRVRPLVLLTGPCPGSPRWATARPSPTPPRPAPPPPPRAPSSPDTRPARCSARRRWPGSHRHAGGGWSSRCWCAPRPRRPRSSWDRPCRPRWRCWPSPGPASPATRESTR